MTSSSAVLSPAFQSHSIYLMWFGCTALQLPVATRRCPGVWFKMGQRSLPKKTQKQKIMSGLFLPPNREDLDEATAPLLIQEKEEEAPTSGISMREKVVICLGESSTAAFTANNHT